MSQKPITFYNEQLKNAKFTSSFLTAYWGDRLVRAIVGCAGPSQALVTCLGKNDNKIEKCTNEAMEQEHCTSFSVIVSATSTTLPSPIYPSPRLAPWRPCQHDPITYYALETFANILGSLELFAACCCAWLSSVSSRHTRRLLFRA